MWLASVHGVRPVHPFLFPREQYMVGQHLPRLRSWWTCSGWWGVGLFVPLLVAAATLFAAVASGSGATSANSSPPITLAQDGRSDYSIVVAGGAALPVALRRRNCRST